MRLGFQVPLILYGVPIPGSQNPYIAGPSARASSTVEVGECGDPSISLEGVDGETSRLVSGYWARLVEELPLDACIRIEARIEGDYTVLGLYASITSVALYEAARSYGETLSWSEIIELSGMLDPLDLDPSMRTALDALRYSALRGSLAVYRNEEENAVFGAGVPALRLGRPVEARSRVARPSLGDAYNALIHLMGVAVLEASLRLKGGEGLETVLGDLKPVHDAVALAVWGLPPSGCIWTPDYPGRFREACVVRGDG